MKPNDFKEPVKTPVTDEAAYRKCVNDAKLFDNTFETILPQTALFDVVNKHFADKSGKAKKAVILGWDGARADALTKLGENSALVKIKKQGGLYLAYTGGIPGKCLTAQQTCTAPGWATFMTGTWSSKHTVRTNGGINMRKTFIKTIAKKGYKTKFNYIWPTHGVTYILERAFAPHRFMQIPNPDKKGMDVVDARLKDAMIADIKNGIDLVFGIFEGPDSFGHQNQFDKDNAAYMGAMNACDNHAKEIIAAIESRPTFASEDWLYVIISDHGGIGTSHGAQIIECRTVFIDINKKII